MDQSPVSKQMIIKGLGAILESSSQRAYLSNSYDATVPCFFKMPEFLARNGYKNPVNPDDGIFQYAKGWKGDMFNYYESHPIESASYNHVMGGVMENQAGWLDIFPHQILLDTANPQSPLVVDVGGNIGHDIERFREAHPEVAHRLYLEDRPEVVARSKCPDTVNHVAYDFFTPQPIKGGYHLSCSGERRKNLLRIVCP
jgi:hypothetical protein